MNASFPAWKTYLSGICIGTADLVPGISGGTVALILGLYEKLIFSLTHISKASLYFLLCIGLGMATAFTLVVHLVHFVLMQNEFRPLLYSFFVGLVLASAVIVFTKIKSGGFYYLALMTASAVVAFLLTKPQVHVAASPDVSWVFLDPYIILSGMAGITAMLLPGVSGSYVLNVLGVYSDVITALARLSSGLKQFTLDMNALNLLFTLGIGVLIGGLLFSKVISWALKHYHDFTLALLTGFMLGSLRSIWPFGLSSGLEIELSWFFLSGLIVLCLGYTLVYFTHKKAHAV